MARGLFTGAEDDTILDGPNTLLGLIVGHAHSGQVAERIPVSTIRPMRLHVNHLNRHEDVHCLRDHL